MLRRFAVIIAVPALRLSIGCTTSATLEDLHPLPAFESVRSEVDGLSAKLVRVLVSGDTSSDVGWFECELLLENRGDSRPLARGPPLPAPTDWSELSGLPAFESANRRNACAVYLSLQPESVTGP